MYKQLHIYIEILNFYLPTLLHLALFHNQNIYEQVPNMKTRTILTGKIYLCIINSLNGKHEQKMLKLI